MSQTTTIKASSRASVKVGDSFYTVEWTEERTVSPEDDLEEERANLWDTANDEVDNQIKDILNAFKK
jgi:hypothetical protein